MTKKQLDYDRLLARERVLVEAMESLWAEINRGEVRQAQIADRLGVSDAYVSQALNGGRNLTLRTLADFAWALDARVHISVSPNAFDESRGSITVTSTVPVEVPGAIANASFPVTGKDRTAFAEAA